MVFFAILTLATGYQVAETGHEQPLAIVTSTDRFNLRSDSRIDLHHFLIAWAASDADEWPPYARPVRERDGWRDGLDPDEQGVWSDALETYRAAVGRSLVFDQGLIALRDWAAGTALGHTVPAADQRLADALIGALPIYQKHWWPGHHERNRRWIASVATQLNALEEEMIPRFEVAYGGRWPSTRIPVDVVVYANDVGAYSTGGRLTISSANRGNQMPHALEMIFHEASHTDEMEQPLTAVVRDAFRAAGGEAPDRFWHDMIFYTSGEITRLVLAQHGETGYQHYGSLGVYLRGERWAAQLSALEDHWRPFLASQAPASARGEALQSVATVLLRDEAARR